MTTYDSLRELVLSGELSPGARVSEAELAARLTVSRTPVREALQRLEAEGLVFAQGRGIRVRIHDALELVQIYEARAALDGHTAAVVARRNGAGELPPARLRDLQNLADQTDRLTRDQRFVEAVEWNREFHQAISSIAGNSVIETTLDRYWDQILVSTRNELREPHRVDEVREEHQRILDAMAQGDATAAYEAAFHHALSTRNLLTEKEQQ
ncbi:GntR family transcriptional regulator [Arthrobacter sp. 2MCAF14]|uniref:GntR family transcriptional regulator n=1 Tax=Arthrobacter sp. 2MCAF14 TaxID=3232982 RepID=UPI003F9038FA